MGGVALAGLWTRNAETGSYHAWYVGENRSASYEIKRLPYGSSGRLGIAESWRNGERVTHSNTSRAWTFELWCNGERVPLAFSSQLKAVKAKAQQIEDAS